MLDIKFILENQELIRETAHRKRSGFDLDRLLTADRERREALAKAEEARAFVNDKSKAISALSGTEREQAIAEMKAQKEEFKALEAAIREAQEEFDRLMLLVPNPPLPEVPEGTSDADNVEVSRWGEPPVFDFEPLDHLALMERADLVDLKRAADKISGSRTYYLKNEGALLELAVLMFTLDKLVTKGFTPFIVPLLVNKEAMTGTGYFPGGEEQAYHLDERDDMYLIGTSEVPVTAYHMNEVLDIGELPKLYCGISPCFRREAGTYGKDTYGLYRIHQFQKVEQVILCENSAEESLKMHRMILANSEEVLRDLGLAYRVAAVCAGEMGQGQVLKHDIETWMPSRNAYCETHSCSSFHEFQARRLKTRYKDKEGKVRYVHTLNNTCIASPRILIPLLEVYQNKDGSVTVPQVLRKYLSGRERIG